ncbi:MAG TPA: immune inhibitor A [Anaerolineae bacterium]|nr:immune inhibitor A [Anaerolineae bacterium]
MFAKAGKLWRLIATVLVLSMVGATPVFAGPSQPDPFLRDGDVIDINAFLEAQSVKEIAEMNALLEQSEYAAEPALQATTVVTPAYKEGDVVTWLGYDTVNPAGHNFYQSYFETQYTVKYIRENCEIWVQNDLNYYNADGTLNQLHPDGKDPEYVTDARLEYVVDVCSDRIQPTNVKFFGNYVLREGNAHNYIDLINARFGTHLSYFDTDNPERIVLLVSNVRDPHYYTPLQSGSFIQGFSSSAFNLYGNRSFITIDSLQWNVRVGNSGHPIRAYEYEGTVAHEMQHMIHRDNDANEESWINEGMSGFSEFLNGYWLTTQLGSRTQWQEWPENSLTLWGDQDNDLPGGVESLADYQLVNAFFLYTAGRMGGVYTDTARLTRSTTQGITSFNEVLAESAQTNPAAVGLTFGTVFRDFRRDMLYGGFTNDVEPTARWNADYIDDYVSPLELAEGESTSQAYVGELRDNLDSQGYHTPGVPPFGTDFIEVCWSQQIADAASWPVTFESAQGTAAWDMVAATALYTPSGTVAGDVLYSGHTDLTDNFIVFGPFTPTTGDLLTFDHYYNIEQAWDYGFVQVTTDTTGMTGWTSLEMTGMITETDSGAHTIIANNVPGFSGFSEGWLTATMSLDEYAGEPMLLAFRYASDWGTGGQDGAFASGWAIDNLEVGGQAINFVTGRSIHAVRGANVKFDFEFLTWKDGHAVEVNKLYTPSAMLSETFTIVGPVRYKFDLAPLAKGGDEGFDEAGESGVFMVSFSLDIYSDLINSGVPALNPSYELSALPPSLCTSDVTAYGAGGYSDTRVRAGEPMTVDVHVDNLGSAGAEVATTGPAMAYVGMEVPTHTTYVANSATNGAVYVADLSQVVAAFPAVPGVYWHGEVTTTADFTARFLTSADLPARTALPAPVHFADAATADPDQSFVDTDTRVAIESALSLSGLKADKPLVMPQTVAAFTAVIVNKSILDKAITLVAAHPADTTFVGVTGATVVATSTTQVTVTAVISPYATAGLTNITFNWTLGDAYRMGDLVTSTMQLADDATAELFTLSATTTVGGAHQIYLPLVLRNTGD